jgi:hypothetical protein
MLFATKWMLSVMTFNVGSFFAVLGGISIGEFFFGPVLQRGGQLARRLSRVNNAWFCFGNESGI